MRNLPSETTFQIGTLATRSGMTPDALRYYERLGLLPRAHRTSGGFRVYTDQALDRLRFIKRARTLGLTLQEIRDRVWNAVRQLASVGAPYLTISEGITLAAQAFTMDVATLSCCGG